MFSKVEILLFCLCIINKKHWLFFSSFLDITANKLYFSNKHKYYVSFYCNNELSHFLAKELYYECMILRFASSGSYVL